MPNVKIFVDETLYPDCRDRLAGALTPLRDMLCHDLRVDIPACQFAVMPVLAMADLPRVNVEMQILPKPDRTREVILSVMGQTRELLSKATGVHVAVRVTALDPETYIAVK